MAVQKEINDCIDMEDWHGHCQVRYSISSGLCIYYTVQLSFENAAHEQSNNVHTS